MAEPVTRQERRRAEREARRQRIDWTNPNTRTAMLAMLHAALAQDSDPTLTGLTLILPDGKEPLYIAKAGAKRRPPTGKPDA